MRVAERLAVVAGGDGFFGSLERVLGGGELGGGELVGAGGAGRIDRALRLVHFLIGRLGAAGREEVAVMSARRRTTRSMSHEYTSAIGAAGRARSARTRVNQLP